MALPAGESETSLCCAARDKASLSADRWAYSFSVALRGHRAVLVQLRMADDEDFEERVAYTFAQMDSNNVGAVNYMQLRKWISAQMKEDDELDVKGITDEMQEASTDAFAKYKRDSDDMLGVDEIAELLRALDLLKYMPEEVRLVAPRLPIRSSMYTVQ